MATFARANWEPNPASSLLVLTLSTKSKSSGQLQRALVISKELPSGCPLCCFQLLFSSSSSFSYGHVRMTDRSQGSTKKPFSSQRVKETLTSKVFKLSHKSVAFRQIEQNGPFQDPEWSSMSALGTKGAPARKGLNGCIILSVAVVSKGPFHTYSHLLLAFLQFLREAADGCHCFKKKLNRRGDADWRQKPFTLPNPWSVFSWSTTVTAICLVCRREGKVRAWRIQSLSNKSNFALQSFPFFPFTLVMGSLHIISEKIPVSHLTQMVKGCH